MNERQPAGTFELPESYILLREIDMKNDKKLAVGVNLAALALAGVMLALGVKLQPMVIGSDLIGVLLFFVAAVLYFVCHELVHGVFIKKYCGKKAKYGFTGLYAFAGRADAYFSASAYAIIAMAPVVLLGLLILVINLLVPASWFWGVYFIQVLNISGAAGDLYCLWLLLRLPKPLYINDDGVSMRFYGPKS